MVNKIWTDKQTWSMPAIGRGRTINIFRIFRRKLCNRIKFVLFSIFSASVYVLTVIHLGRPGIFGPIEVCGGATTRVTIAIKVQLLQCTDCPLILFSCAADSLGCTSCTRIHADSETQDNVKFHHYKDYHLQWRFSTR